jgi:hypothetical protein
MPNVIRLHVEEDAMNDQLKLRASDSERQQVVDLLRAALEDGRLKTEEYADRVELAYRAVTHGDLAPLHADLPGGGAGAATRVTVPAAAATARRVGFAALPMVLRALWTVWLVAVSINVVIWVLVSGTSGHLAYPWPLWVAGPSGAALFGLSAPVSQVRRGRSCPGQRRPVAQG